MRLFLDTEFIEDGATIKPLSIGIAREDGAEYYAEFDTDHSTANDWVRANVLPHLTGFTSPTEVIAREIIKFAGPGPEWWGYYCDYDWVLLCQIYGTMMDLPDGWPMFCMDLKQLLVSLGDPRMPKQSGDEHHALADARWISDTWNLVAECTCHFQPQTLGPGDPIDADWIWDPGCPIHRTNPFPDATP